MRLLALALLLSAAGPVQVPVAPPPSPPIPVRIGGPIPQTGEGFVEGVVKRLNGGTALNGVLVSLLGPPDKTGALSELTSTTDGTGRFVFRYLPVGRYTVRATRDGYFLSRPAGMADPFQVNVGPGATVAMVSLSMVQGGTISGRVLDPMGRPAPVSAVTAVRRFYEDGRPLLRVIRSTTSNDRGEFRIFWLEPGEYLVMAEKNLPTGLARGYFPGGDDGRSALPVRVSEGEETARTDFLLGSIPTTVTVSGIVASEIPSSAPGAPPAETTPPTLQERASQGRSYEPLERPEFFLLPLDASRAYEKMAAYSNAIPINMGATTGKFELRNVPGGLYQIYVVMRDKASRYYVAHQPITVGTQPLSGVVLVLKPGFDLNGTVTAGIGKPAPPVHIYLRPRLALPGWTDAAAMPSDGAFQFSNVPPGEYMINVEPLEPDTYLAELLHGSDSILEKGIVTVGPGQADRLDALIQPSAARIRGKVSASPAQLSAGITITLVPAEGREGNLALYKRIITADGEFSFSGVSPGRYRILAWETIPDGAEQNEEFMENFRDEGTYFTVSPQSTSVIEVRLITK